MGFDDDRSSEVSKREICAPLCPVHGEPKLLTGNQDPYHTQAPIPRPRLALYLSLS